MSDLFCPATLVVARHGEAAYETSGVLSNDGGCLTELGRTQARALADSLADRRIAAIWCSDLARAVQTAEIAAARLGLSVRVRVGLREASVGGWAGRPEYAQAFDDVFRRWLDGDLTASPPDAENGADVARRVSAELDAVADLFRGETVLVVSHGAAMGVTLPRLATNVPADYPAGRPLGNADTCEVEIDADGWVLRTWASRPVQ